MLGLRLNIRLYNNLDKETENFKELRDGQGTPHTTEYSYY